MSEYNGHERRQPPCSEIVEVKEMMIKLNQIILGNGVKGMADMVAGHEKYIQKQIGGMRMMKFFFTMSGVTGVGMVVLILQGFKVL